MYTIVGADGKEYGPITAAHIREWILDGRVNLQTRAKLDRENVWKTLGNFAEFARQTAPTQTTPTPSAPPIINVTSLWPAFCHFSTSFASSGDERERPVTSRRQTKGL